MARSHALFTAAKRVIPGGVNSPVRAFQGVGGDPVFFAQGEGAYLMDADGQRYIDYVGSWGPLILGHAHPRVVAAVQAAAARGLSFGAPTEIEVLMAQTLTELIPSIDMVRMVNSGTEATLSAIRLARGYTGRNKILKFNGCYHGHSDSLLIRAGSGLLTLGIPTSRGVPTDFAQHTLTAEFNDLDSVEQYFKHWGNDIAGIIIEPVAGNMGCIPPLPGFLQGLRKLCDDHGSVLIFDEVMTGFRVALGGAQALYGVKPDLTTLGKVIGGGMPVGAFGGRREIMSHLAPLGEVYQAGTLSGNPVTLAAGLATLDEIKQPGFFEALSTTTQKLVNDILALATDAGIAMRGHAVGGMFGLFFTDAPQIRHYQDVMACHAEQFKTFFHGLLQQGVYLAPSAFEAGFVSAAHTLPIINATLCAVQSVFSGMKPTPA